MTVDTTRTISRSFTRFFKGTFLSRVSGLLRDVCLAIFFGTSPEIATFMASYRLANVFRRIFGESLVGSVFVPHFEELKRESEEKAHLFFRDLVVSLGLFLVLFALGISLLMTTPTPLVQYSKVMLFGLVFICLYALNASFLQCHKSYFLPSSAPIFFNLSMIFCMVLWGGGVSALSYAVVLGFFVQWMATQIGVARFSPLTLSKWLKPRLFSKEMRALSKPFLLGLIGVGAVQINSALDAFFSRIHDLSGPSYLWYALRVQQLPIALFGIALASSIFPPLTRAKGERFNEILEEGLKKGVALMCFSFGGLILLGKEIIELLFGYGHFGLKSVTLSFACLKAYSYSLLPFILVLIFTHAFHAKKEYKMPAIASGFSVLLNILLNSYFVFVQGRGAVSVAIATSMACFVNALILVYAYCRQYDYRFPSATLFSFLRIFSVTFTSFWLTRQFIGSPDSLFKGVSIALMYGLMFYWLHSPLKGRVQNR